MKYCIQQCINAPSQINERQSSHETCTRVAAEGVVADDDAAMTELDREEHGWPLPTPPEYVLDPPPREDRGGGGALQ